MAVGILFIKVIFGIFTIALVVGDVSTDSTRHSGSVNHTNQTQDVEYTISSTWNKHSDYLLLIATTCFAATPINKDFKANFGLFEGCLISTANL